jgi:aminoglycoside phosphotransferase (APT) family kinase protein
MTTAPTQTDVAEFIRTYLQRRLPDASTLELRDVHRIAVGWSHETWLFDASWTASGGRHEQGFCLRRDPGNTLLREKSDLAVQYKVLACLEPTPVPTPKPFFFEPEGDELGTPFLVMEKVSGVCPSPWSRDGRAFYAAAAGRGVLPQSFTEALSSLHNLDWRAAGLSFLGAADPGRGFSLSEIAKWQSLIDRSGLEPDPVLVDLVCWLTENAPVTERTVLVHGAYRTGNLLIGDDDRVSGILDWELQVLGDPMYDVAYVLSDLNREGTELLSNVVGRDDFYAWYEAATGIEIDDELCRYFQLLYEMRSAAFWMSAAGLYAQGLSDDLRLARMAWAITPVLERAARDLGY